MSSIQLPMYVFSELIFPLWDQILSLETCLGSVYSVDMFRGSIIPRLIGNTNSEMVI